jgi:hypothetical protein
MLDTYINKKNDELILSDVTYNKKLSDVTKTSSQILISYAKPFLNKIFGN